MLFLASESQFLPDLASSSEFGENNNWLNFVKEEDISVKRRKRASRKSSAKTTPNPKGNSKKGQAKVPLLTLTLTLSSSLTG